MSFLNSLLPYAVPLALVLHAVSSLIHSYIVHQNGKDHSIVLDQVSTAVDNFANLVEKQQRAAQQNSSITSGGA